MRVALPIVAAFALAACTPEPEPVDTDPVGLVSAPQLEVIEAAMEESAAGWNEGDMDRFLAIYSSAKDTSFVGSGGLIRGAEAMEERYREAYDWSQADPAERGVLTFETEDFRPLGSDYALYIGRYTLTYPDDREPATGLTSLIFAREQGGWKIMADHSS
ncbi:YybH family protein [Aurantiacibacter hainanensis]|uniref:YybH family protein n=1 Tax=Aurantiacibacter hainanensis TaxID=3076114 RepID=UPI0030C6B565